MSIEETTRQETKRHVMTLLVASHRALNNALDDLGFEENDDRVVEHDGRLAFVTCSHEADLAVHDLDSEVGVEQLRGELSRLDPATLFVSLGAGADGQVVARVVQRTPRRTLAIAKGPDEARMRNAIREILPTVMFDIVMKPPR